MRKASIFDKDLVTGIISESFIDNPSVVSVIKNDKRKKQRIVALAKYAFKTAISRDGVYISSDNNGVAICYRYNTKKESLSDYWSQLILVIESIGVSRVFKILKREAYIKRYRHKSGNFLYFWFFGVNKEGRGNGAAMELKNAILEESKNKNLPIYLETSVEKNKAVYERYGFEVYHTWENTDKNMTLWFMKKESH